MLSNNIPNPNEEQATGPDIRHLMPVKAMVQEPVSPLVITEVIESLIPEEPSNPS
tara:strand:- start:3315 stop:3479 length:165 start_codon:yes stop_codon:yes gene_type:complete